MSQFCGFAVSFAPDPARVVLVRRTTAARLRMWGVPCALAEDIVVAVSELATNAVQHGFGDVVLKVERVGAGLLRIAVSDGNPAPAELRLAAEGDVSGRGLFLVAAFAENWGVSDGGKTTWCIFRLPSGRP
ncbi:ATP-binding protein [Streptomyces sp. NPDC050161]|uniref:ATP-binding protein n=1 Tax=Streptomyces sp. NPDC050161 TaxID=3365604 RepID=UPI0037B3CFA8